MTVAAVFGRSALGEAAEDLRESVNGFLASRSSEAIVRSLIESEAGFDAEVWTRMAQQLDLQGMAVPERFGGSGFDVDAQAVVFEELGAALTPTPYLANVLATEALLATGDDTACGELLPAIAAGERRAAVALVPLEDVGGANTIPVTVVSTDDGAPRLHGEHQFVLDGATADLLVVVARSGSASSVFVVEADGEGVTRVPMQTLDLTRRQARVQFDGAAARQVGDAGAALSVSDHVYRRAAIALSCELVGCAVTCLDMSVEYALDRVQFGRPIGSFQAVKHKCAEMLRLTAQSRAIAHEAAIAAAAGRPDAALLASAAKSYCAEACGWVAAETIQVHGGIGYTWEHPAHLYFRRIKSDAELFGGPRFHRGRVVIEAKLSEALQ